ncbi:hypothetical protein B0H14DRAFT_1287030 [Mycena olivaceomarginata]|nr:hypothetical protein B0H14DRAFT_1287030 [Mycena olivaceomarginata]
MHCGHQPALVFAVGSTAIYVGKLFSSLSNNVFCQTCSFTRARARPDSYYNSGNSPCMLPGNCRHRLLLLSTVYVFAVGCTAVLLYTSGLGSRLLFLPDSSSFVEPGTTHSPDKARAHSQFLFPRPSCILVILSNSEQATSMQQLW